MELSGSYNAWTNYLTWAVYSWFSSDEATNSAIEDLARKAKTIHEAADQIRKLVEDFNPLAEQASMYMDILTFAIGMVNFDEIASAYDVNEKQ